MSDQKNDEIRKAKELLNSLDEKQKRGSQLKDLVYGIAEDVQEKMREGFTLEQIVEKLNEVRDEEDQINVGTFRGYLQKIRKEKGLEPVRKHKKPSLIKTTRKTSKPKKTETKEVKQKIHTEENPNTQSEFRNMDNV